MTAILKEGPHISLPRSIMRKAGFEPKAPLEVVGMDGLVFIARPGTLALGAGEVFPPPAAARKAASKSKPAKRKNAVVFGGWEGRIAVPDDFDAPLGDFKEYMP
jgi:hypothetical protein